MAPHRLLALGLALMCALAGVSAVLLSPLHAKNPQLQAELVAMQDTISNARQLRDGALASTVAQMRVTELNAANVARLHAILDQYGWPGKKLVGKDGSHAAYLLAALSVGHDPATVVADQAFLQRVLTLMNRAGDDVDKTDRAILDDRVAAMTGQPQRYGTQLKCEAGVLMPLTPIRDRAHLDERRAAVGLRPFRAQLKNVAFQVGCLGEDGGLRGRPPRSTDTP